MMWTWNGRCMFWLGGVPNVENDQTKAPGDAMTIAQARKLAARDKHGWCILPSDFDLVIGRLNPNLRITKVCCDKGNVLRFPSIPSAREFLREKLLVPRSMLFPVPPEV